MRREQQTLVRGINREQCCQRVQGMTRERAANTGRRSKHRAALPEIARDEERAADTGRSEQRAALPESARDEERAENRNTIFTYSAVFLWVLLVYIIILDKT